MNKLIISSSYEETLNIGERLAISLPNGSVIALYGDLGVGKTALVKGVANGLHIKENVLSPTFNIMKLYLKGDRPLVHIDAYRLDDVNTDIGLDEFIGIENGLTMIEWPMYITNLLPNNTISITITRLDENKRQLEFKGNDLSFLEDNK